MEIRIRDDEITVSGYVNAVERESRTLPQSMCRGAAGPFRERVKAGTFQRAIESATNIELRFNHERTIGGTHDGTLQLEEDAVGLRAMATIRDGEAVRAARDGRLTGWSFGFANAKDTWSEDEDGAQLRTLEGLELREVSILTKQPAYIATTVEMRGEDESILETRSAADALEVCEMEKRKTHGYEKTWLDILKIKGRNGK